MQPLLLVMSYGTNSYNIMRVVEYRVLPCNWGFPNPVLQSERLTVQLAQNAVHGVAVPNAEVPGVAAPNGRVAREDSVVGELTRQRTTT